MKYFDLIYFDLQIIDRNKCFINEYPDILIFSYFVKNTLPHRATFIKRIAFEKTNLYSEEFKIVSDWKFFIECICKFNSSGKRIDVILSNFYLDGISAHSDYFSEREKVLKDQFVFL
jgi:hypothetical protein